jgi:hypothetical protein
MVCIRAVKADLLMTPNRRHLAVKDDETEKSANTPDTVSIEMRQEVRHHKGQVIEREVRAFPQGTNYSPLLVRRLPGEVMWASRMVVTIGDPTLAPFADGLGADPITFREGAAWLRRSGDFRACNGRSAGIRMNLEHGSPPSQNGAPQALKSAAIHNYSMTDRIPTMFRDQTTSQAYVCDALACRWSSPPPAARKPFCKYMATLRMRNSLRPLCGASLDRRIELKEMPETPVISIVDDDFSIPKATMPHQSQELCRPGVRES